MFRRLAAAATLAVVAPFAQAVVVPALSAAHAAPVMASVYIETSPSSASFTPDTLDKASQVPAIIQNTSTRTVIYTASTGEQHTATPGTVAVFTSLTGPVGTPFTITANVTLAVLRVNIIA